MFYCVLVNGWWFGVTFVWFVCLVLVGLIWFGLMIIVGFVVLC